MTCRLCDGTGKRLRRLAGGMASDLEPCFGCGGTGLGSHTRAREDEQRREVMQQALACVYSGADFTDADAVLDHLGDRGATVVMDQ